MIAKLSEEDARLGYEIEVFEVDGQKYSAPDILICATHGKIYAIHKRDGKRIWRAQFKSWGFGGVLSLFVTDYNSVMVAGGGRTACLDLFTGEIQWINKMPGFGIREVSVITAPTKSLLPPATPPSKLRSDATGIASTERPVVFSSSRGKVMAIDGLTGEILWTYNCPGGGFKLPVTIVEPPSLLVQGRPYQVVYIGAGRHVYCLVAETGKVIWNAHVSNSVIGQNYMTLATAWSSRLAAETHSAFSQSPSAQQRARMRQKEQKRRMEQLRQR